MTTVNPADPNSIYQLKLTLRNVKPQIWRRILVQADTSLGELHFILAISLGWTCAHAHSFEFGSRTFGDSEMDPDGELKFEDEREATLVSLVEPGQKFTYRYDFGDDWVHDVELEQVLAPDDRMSYPLCIGGARACPPEDCGGTPGYAHLLEVLKNPKADDYDELFAWVGGYFDPEGFDANRANIDLTALYECDGCEHDECECDHDDHDHGHSHGRNRPMN
jgi:hypothetical protein